MKTLKKVIIIVLTAVMLTTALSLPAAAATGNGNAVVKQLWLEDIKFQLAQAIAAVANAQINLLVSLFQAMPNPNIGALISTTNAISAAAIAAINALGFDAVCEYVTYEIGGQLVEIDPIIVIDRT